MKKILLIILLLTLVSCSPQKEIKFGVMSDIHGNIDGVEKVVDIFDSRGVSGVIIAGDSVLNEQLRYGREDSVEDAIELRKILEIVSSLNVPIFIIPGNHETKSMYYSVVNDFEQVVDMSIVKHVDLEGVDLISLPGYYLNVSDKQKFLSDDGFFVSDSEILDLQNVLYFDDPLLLISHGPPRGVNGKGLDVTESGQNVGSELLYSNIRDLYDFGVFGHIHESRGVYSANYEKIDAGKVSDSLWLNPGALEEGHAAIFSIFGNYGVYEFFEIK